MSATSKIPNYKHQITNKFQFRNLNDQNRLGFRILVIGICLSFVICDLGFIQVICNTDGKP